MTVDVDDSSVVSVVSSAEVVLDCEATGIVRKREKWKKWRKRGGNDETRYEGIRLYLSYDASEHGI